MFVLFSFDLDASFLSSFGGGNGRIALDNMVCNGNEQRLEMCSSTSIGVHNCDHTEDVGITCAQGIYEQEQKSFLQNEGNGLKGRNKGSLQRYRDGVV